MVRQFIEYVYYRKGKKWTMGITDAMRYNMDHGNNRSHKVQYGPWE